MNLTMQGLRNAAAVALAWAAGWAVAGMAIGVASRVSPFLPWDVFFGQVFDAPLPALALPGFFAGLMFAVLVACTAGHRRFDAWPYALAFGAGAAAGVVLVCMPVLIGVAEGALLPVASALFIAVMGGLAGAASLALARWNGRRPRRRQVAPLA